MNKAKAYGALFALLLASIQIKYAGTVTNPFQSTPTLSLFVTAITCHGLTASIADMNLLAPTVIVHLSGIVGCEVLVWVLVPEILWFSIINILVLLVAFLCFFNTWPTNLLQYNHDDQNNETPVTESQPHEEQV